MSRYLYVGVSLLIIADLILESGCEQRMEQHARISPETCSQYPDVDKRNWCLGHCEEIKNIRYRQICRSNHGKNKD